MRSINSFTAPSPTAVLTYHASGSFTSHCASGLPWSRLTAFPKSKLCGVLNTYPRSIYTAMSLKRSVPIFSYNPSALSSTFTCLLLLPMPLPSNSIRQIPQLLPLLSFHPSRISSVRQGMQRVLRSPHRIAKS